MKLSIVKGRVCGFVGNTGNNGIIFNESLWEQSSCFGVAILYRHTPVGKNFCERIFFVGDFFVAIWQEMAIYTIILNGYKHADPDLQHLKQKIRHSRSINV